MLLSMFNTRHEFMIAFKFYNVVSTSKSDDQKCFWYQKKFENY